MKEERRGVAPFFLFESLSLSLSLSLVVLLFLERILGFEIEIDNR